MAAHSQQAQRERWHSEGLGGHPAAGCCLPGLPVRPGESGIRTHIQSHTHTHTHTHVPHVHLSICPPRVRPPNRNESIFVHSQQKCSHMSDSHALSSPEVSTLLLQMQSGDERSGFSANHRIYSLSLHWCVVSPPIYLAQACGTRRPTLKIAHETPAEQVLKTSDIIFFVL